MINVKYRCYLYNLPESLNLGSNLRANAKIITVPDHLHFSIWAQDGYAVVKEPSTDKAYFIEPYQFPRYADGLIAEFVANNTEMENSQAPLYFQGGNILIGDDFFMIGADYPANSLQYVGHVIAPNQGESNTAFIKRLFSEYLDMTKKLIYIGSTIPVPAQSKREIQINGEAWTEYLYYGNHEGTVQPLFHIDMFITLAGRGVNGRYQVVVGDPRLAAKTLDVPLWPHSMQEVYDNIANGLERLNFEVVRNPLPLVYADDPDDKVRTWYFATANNALVEIREQKEKKVWLPTYGHGNWKALAATDEKNRQIWEAMGFGVVMLGDFHPFAENLGAVHCIQKYLKRG